MIILNGESGPKTSSGSDLKNPNCIILNSWVFENFILAGELFAKAIWILETCVSVNNNLREKLVSSLEFPIKFDERFKITSVPFFILNF